MAYTNTLTPVTSSTIANENEMNSRLGQLKGNTDYNKSQHESHTANFNNPHAVTKLQVGLSNVDNTSDANKSISTAQAAVNATKVDKVAGKQLSTEDYTTTEKSKLTGIAAGANKNEFVTEMPEIANRIVGVFYWKVYYENGQKKVAWIENHLGEKFDIHDYPSKLITMLPDGTFPSVKCANHFIRGLTVNGNTVRNYINKVSTGFTLNGAYANSYTIPTTGYDNTKTYDVVIDVKSMPTGSYTVQIRNSTTIYSLTGKLTNVGKNVLTLPVTGQSGELVYVRINDGLSTDVFEINYIIITDSGSGSKVTRYIPFGLSSAGDLDIPTNPLRILPNGVKDEITNPTTGAVTRRTGKAILNSTSNWSLSSAINPYTYRFAISGWSTTNNAKLQTGIQTQYKEINNDLPYAKYDSAGNDIRCISLHNTDTNLYLRVEKYKIDAMIGADVVAKLKAYLDKYPITLEYELITPIQETYNPQDFKIYILTSVNDAMKRVQVGDYLRSLPNLVKDEAVNTVGARRTKEYMLVASDITLRSTGTNVSVYQFMLPIDKVASTDNHISPILNKTYISTDSGWDNINRIGMYYFSLSEYRNVRIEYPLGTTLDQVKLELVGLKIAYQLATPTYETIDITQIQTTQGDNIIKNFNSVLPSEMTATVCQTSDQALGDIRTAMFAHGIII